MLQIYCSALQCSVAVWKSLLLPLLEICIGRLAKGQGCGWGAWNTKVTFGTVGMIHKLVLPRDSGASFLLVSVMQLVESMSLCHSSILFAMLTVSSHAQVLQLIILYSGYCEKNGPLGQCPAKPQKPGTDLCALTFPFGRNYRIRICILAWTLPLRKRRHW